MTELPFGLKAKIFRSAMPFGRALRPLPLRIVPAAYRTAMAASSTLRRARLFGSDRSRPAPLWGAVLRCVILRRFCSRASNSTRTG